MSSSSDNTVEHTAGERLRRRGQELGFCLIGITSAARPDSLEHFRDWLAQGHQGEMAYIPRREQAYEHPRGVQVGVKSIIVGALNYGPGLPSDSLPQIDENGRLSGRVAAYAQGTGDYHDLLRSRLSELAAELHRLLPQARTRIAIDTAPLLERDVARRAGLGWFGKNTMLINKFRGSYFFLGGILTDIELAPDQPHATDHCGTCTRCLEACPTQAFPAAHVLDARRCISYLTIELRNQPIPGELRAGMGDWLFGCDVCQQVCPWNRKAIPTGEPGLKPAPETLPDPRQLLSLTAPEFQQQYGKTPFARPGHDGMGRNAAIVLGNTHSENAIPALVLGLHANGPLTRGASAWGLGQISSEESRAELLKRLAVEVDAAVISEIESALKTLDSKSL